MKHQKSTVKLPSIGPGEPIVQKQCSRNNLRTKDSANFSCKPWFAKGGCCIRFLKEYIKQPFTVGAIAPSSRFLAQKMLEDVDFSRARFMIEYGPGTGVFTRELVARKRPDTVLLVIESNPNFYRLLYEEFKGEPNVFLVLGSAVNVKNYMGKLKMQKADYIISGLPFTSLPQKDSMAILERTQEILSPNGCFITFQYTVLKKTMFEQFFHIRKTSFACFNIPPAFVFNMKK